MAVFYSPYAFYPSYYLFFSCFTNRVSLDPVFFRGACGTLEGRGRGAVPSLAAPPGPRLQLQSQTAVF